MAWSSEKQAGFALAALLFEDRALDSVAAAIPEREHAAIAQRLRASSDTKHVVRTLLASVRPGLGEAALALSPRARGLLARLCPPALRGRMAQGAPQARAHFSLDEALFAVLLRAAQRTQAKVV